MMGTSNERYTYRNIGTYGNSKAGIYEGTVVATFVKAPGGTAKIYTEG